MTFKPDRSKTHHPAQPLTRAHMPTDFDVSLKAYTKEGAHRIPPYLGLGQPMAGFDPEYRNIIDYIVRITYRIWETKAREVDYIGDCYSDDTIVFDDYGLQYGNEKIIADTYHTTGAFPDVVADAEEVIWAGDEDVGFHTSHRARMTGTNTAESRYGPPTGAKVNILAMANCVTKGNDIFHEHVLYNTTAMLSQLGVDLWEEAERLVAEPPAGWPRSAGTWDALRGSVSPPKPLSEGEPVEGFDPDAFARYLHDNVWNGDGSVLGKHYAPGVPFEGGTNRAFSGTEALSAYVQEIRNAFPDLALQVDEVYWMGNDADGYVVSTRWSAEGTHSGGKAYREPSNARCQLWGMTQQEIKDGKVMREWQLFNEFDLMMQIAKARRDD